MRKLFTVFSVTAATIAFWSGVAYMLPDAPPAAQVATVNNFDSTPMAKLLDMRPSPSPSPSPQQQELEPVAPSTLPYEEKLEWYNSCRIAYRAGLQGMIADMRRGLMHDPNNTEYREKIAKHVAFLVKAEGDCARDLAR